MPILKKSSNSYFINKYFNKQNTGIHNYSFITHFFKFSRFNNYSNKSSMFNSNMSPFQKLVNLSMRSGLKQTSLNLILNVFKDFFFLVKHESSDFNIKYISSKYKEYSITRTLRINSPFYLNDVLLDIIKKISPMYTLKTNKYPFKKSSKKKKKKSKYMVKLVFVKPLSRNLIPLKWINSGSSWYNGINYSTRLFKSILNSYLGGENSFIWKKKIKIYQKVIANYKKKKNE